LRRGDDPEDSTRLDTRQNHCACGQSTPFDGPVVPDVYMITDGSPGPTEARSIGSPGGGTSRPRIQRCAGELPA